MIEQRKLHYYCDRTVRSRREYCSIRSAARKFHFQQQKQTVDNNDIDNDIDNDSDQGKDKLVVVVETSEKPPPVWPCMDSMDRRLISVTVPVIANNAILPLIGAVDLFWVNQMNEPLAVAGQAAANQIFNSIFWLASFIPAISATIISKEYASIMNATASATATASASANNKYANGNNNVNITTTDTTINTSNNKGVEESICQALLMGIVLASIPTVLLLLHPNSVLSSVLPMRSTSSLASASGLAPPALQYARPYLLIRAFSFIPALISLVGFAAFRATFDTITPVKISLFANLFNAVLDPILIFTMKMGVSGAAIATLGAELVSAATYLYLLRQRKLIRLNQIFRIPSWNRIKPLIRGGAALQLRTVAINLTFLAVARTTQTIDTTGIAASAHAIAIQTFQLGGIVLLALSIVSQTIIPSEMVLSKQKAKWYNNRLMSWGLVMGTVLGLLQILAVPLLQRTTPILAVREAAYVPAILCSIYQIMNGLIFIGEGVMVGTGNYFQLSIHTVIATIGCLWALQTFPSKFGLTGVWIGFGVFNILRFVGVAIHQLITGPFAVSSSSSSSSSSLSLSRQIMPTNTISATTAMPDTGTSTSSTSPPTIANNTTATTTLS